MAAVQPASWIDEVSGDELMKHTTEIARWVRLSGTEDERKAFDYVAGVLQGYGLKTKLHLPTCLVSLPVSGSIRVGDETFEPCITHAFSIATPEGGISGELVYAGRGTDEEFAAARVHGKIVLTEGLATPNKAHAASEAGALAVISISGPHIHEMIVSPVWGSPTPDRLDTLPTVAMLSIDTDTGGRLKKILEAGPTRATVHTDVDTRWRQIPVLIADLDVDDREYLMFSGHIDSWHYGAMDNGSANATMIETARIMAAHRADLRRGIRFAFWSGHSHARYAGSTWFADRYWFELHERCVAHVNVDSAGAIGATNLTGANTMAETYPLAREIIGRQVDQNLTYKRFGRAGDQSFWGVGLSSFYMSMSEQGEADEMTADQAFLLGGTTARGGGLGWWWHTTEDTIDKVDRDNLIRDTRVYIETVGRLATEPVVALDVRAALDEIAASLETIKPLWAGLPSDGPDDDPGFSALEADIASAQQAADRVMAKLSAGDRSDTQSQQLSDSIVTACKALVPVNYTLTGQFDHDLALGASPLPALRPHRPVVEMSDDEQWGASHQLRRSINRVRAGVRAATSALETASAS
jgi:hypothetical protein